MWRRRRWRAYLLNLKRHYPRWWYSQALCIHHHEGAWHIPYGIGPQVSGGMQISLAAWRAYGGHTPAAYLAPAWAQLRVAYRYWRVAGWAPWPETRIICHV